MVVNNICCKIRKGPPSYEPYRGKDTCNNLPFQYYIFASALTSTFNIFNIRFKTFRLCYC